MQIAYVRHGERRKGEVDPELTSYGFRMVEESAQWLKSIGFEPGLAQATQTTRTRQTVETILAHFPDTVLETILDAPEIEVDWDQWTEDLANRPRRPDSVLLVGHHPTLEMLLESFGPAPVVVSRHHFAVVLLLVQESKGWRITQAWPGRRS